MLATKPSPAGATRPATGDRASAQPAPPRALRPFRVCDLPLNDRGEIDWRTSASWTPTQRAAAFAEDDARMAIEGGSSLTGADTLLDESAPVHARWDVEARRARGHWLDALDQNYWIPDGDDVCGCIGICRCAGGAR